MTILISDDTKTIETIFSGINADSKQVQLNPTTIQSHKASRINDNTAHTRDDTIRDETISLQAITPKKIEAEEFQEGEQTYYKIGKQYLRIDLDDNITGIKHSCYYRHRKEVIDAQK